MKHTISILLILLLIVFLVLGCPSSLAMCGSEPFGFVFELEYPEDHIIRLIAISNERKMIFYGDDGKEIGVLSFAQTPITFEGEANASAQKFFQALSPYFERITCDYQRKEDTR